MGLVTSDAYNKFSFMVQIIFAQKDDKFTWKLPTNLSNSRKQVGTFSPIIFIGRLTGPEASEEWIESGGW